MFWFTLAFFSLVVNVVSDMQTNFIKSQEIILAGTNDWAKKNQVWLGSDAEGLHIQL